MRRIIKFLREEDGPATVEYAVVLAMILMAVIGVIAGMGTSTADAWQSFCEDFEAVGFFR